MMKKVCSLLAALVLLLSCAPVRAEEPVPDALPQPGETVFGFEAKEIREFPLIGASLVLFEHQKTGAKLLYVANGDTNRAFQLAFRTRPIDNTGLPHVFEHATLSGSEKYPSTSLFMNLSFQTYNTFMNAYTMDAMTAYPMASLSEAQLLSLADYYTSSCLHPLVMTDEHIFRTEAWRYEMTGMESDLTYNGTVYSEMSGALTLERAAVNNANRAIFPGSSLSLDYGGEPDAIPEMTWDSLKVYHDRYYHPSNCFAVLYGSFEDYTRFLELLDEAFSPYEKAEFPEQDGGYVRISEPSVTSVPYPVEEGSDPSGRSVVCYYILCPGLKESPADERILDHVCRLLGNSASPLMQNLRKAIPTGSFSVGREIAGPEDAVLFMATSANAGDAELFRSTVSASLSEIAENGFDPVLLDSAAASLRLSNKLALESGDPVSAVLQPFAYYYAVTGNPFFYAEETEAMENILAENADGLLTDSIRTWLADPALYTLTTTYPAPGEKEKHDAALAEKLAAVKASMSDIEKQAVIDATLAEAGDADNSAMVASLKPVSVGSLPEEIREYPVSDSITPDGIRRIEAAAGVDGVGTAMLYLDMRALPQEDLHYFRLYTRLIGQMDTDAHSKEELSVLMSRYLMNASFGIAAYDTEEREDFQSYLMAQWTALDEDLESGYALVNELLFHTRFSDFGVLADRIQAQKSFVRNQFNSAGYNLQLIREFGATDPYYRLMAYLNGLEYYLFLEELERKMDEHPEEVAARLSSIAEFAANRSGAMDGFAGNESSMQINRPLADAFWKSLKQEPREAPTYDLPAPAAREAVIIDSNIQFNLAAATFRQMGIEPDWSLGAVCTLVQDQLLMPVLRDQMGVYTPICGMMDDLGIYLATFRDPNIAATFEFYETLPDRIAALSLTQNTVDGYIMRTYSSLAKPNGELSGAILEIERILSGKPADEKLTCMRALKSVTPETVREASRVFALLLEKGSRGTVGGAGAVSACRDLYDTVVNPFHAKDLSAQDFEDVPESSEAYAAVRFAFERGMMAPLGDDRFGAAEPATVGDLLAAIYTGAGGPAGVPEEALSWLAGYGLVRPDQDLSEELQEGFLCSLLNGAFGTGLQTDAPDAPVLRGDLAETLMSLFSAPAA